MQKKTKINKGSISKILREENKSNDLFEIMLNNLTIEEIISLKLELVSKSVGKMIYGMPIWRNLNYIVKDAVLKFTVCNTPSNRAAARFLGVEYKLLRELIKQYNIKEYINKEEK